MKSKTLFLISSQIKTEMRDAICDFFPPSFLNYDVCIRSACKVENCLMPIITISESQFGDYYFRIAICSRSEKYVEAAMERCVDWQ